MQQDDDTGSTETAAAVEGRLEFWRKQRAHAEAAGYRDGIATAARFITEYTARLDTLQGSMPGVAPGATDTER